MAERKKIGILFSYNENWTGGIYYILNVIHALSIIENDLKPGIYILSNNKQDFKYNKNNTDYPFLYFYNLRVKFYLFKRLYNIIINIFRFKEIPLLRTNIPPTFDAIFPIQYYDRFPFFPLSKKFYWIPDLQEHFYPDLFDQNDITNRKQFQLLIATSKRNVIFSSNSIYTEFGKIYPEYISNCAVLRFTSRVKKEKFAESEVIEVFKKHNIVKPFFYCPNQFWKHKNHMLLIQAFGELVKSHSDVSLILSGKENDIRNPDYFKEITDIINSFEVRKNIKMLGFIDYQDVLILISESLAVIQPSLSEGWSTSVEDSKALNAYIIASDLNVHKEQLEHYPNYSLFDKNQVNSLSAAMTDRLSNKNPNKDYIYFNDQKRFGNDIIKVLNLD